MPVTGLILRSMQAPTRPAVSSPRDALARLIEIERELRRQDLTAEERSALETERQRLIALAEAEIRQEQEPRGMGQLV